VISAFSVCQICGRLVFWHGQLGIIENNFFPEVSFSTPPSIGKTA
jgi:hypothetical protein